MITYTRDAEMIYLRFRVFLSRYGYGSGSEERSERSGPMQRENAGEICRCTMQNAICKWQWQWQNARQGNANAEDLSKKL